MANLADLKAKLDEAGFKYEDGVLECYDGEASEYLSFLFPVAREFEEIKIFDRDNIDCIVNSNFTEYRGIINYEAIWSKDLKKIECEIDSQVSSLPTRLAMRRISKLFNQNAGDDRPTGDNADTPSRIAIYKDSKTEVSVGYSSREFAILSTLKNYPHFDLSKESSRFRLTLIIDNISVATQEDAKKILEKIANTLFFQIDILYGLILTLLPRRKSRNERIRRLRRSSGDDENGKKLELQYEYDEVPMSLYWLAQNTYYSPIFKYFALYQVVEFYYPIYATADTKNRIKNLIKDPQFNINKDSDVVRLLSIMSTKNVSAIGDERGQLNITVRSTVSGEEIIDLIKNNDALYDYYTNNKFKKLSVQKLRLTDPIGIIDDVANRIYDIRCGIVHSKASEIENKILPITKEVDFLDYETQVLEFIARKVIIANSRPFAMQ